MSETKQAIPLPKGACSVTCPDCHMTIVHERSKPAEPSPEVKQEETCVQCGKEYGQHYTGIGGPTTQPVEEPREPEDDCNPDPHSGRLKFEHPHLPAPVEGVERVTDEPQCDVVAEANRLVPGARCTLPMGHAGAHVSSDDGYMWVALDAAVPAKRTDDRPAETILQEAIRIVREEPTPEGRMPGSTRRMLAEHPAEFTVNVAMEAMRDALIRRLTALDRRAETRIEVLEAAMKRVIQFNRDTARDQYGNANKAELWACVKELRAALAAPSGVKEKV